MAGTIVLAAFFIYIGDSLLQEGKNKMIHVNYSTQVPVKNSVFRISDIGGQHKIEAGEIQGQFTVNQTVIVSPEKPELFWDLLNTLMGIKAPEIKPAQKTAPEKKPTNKISEPTPSNGLRDELNKLSSKEIVDKVYREKGIKITNSLKSKAAILTKALKIFE